MTRGKNAVQGTVADKLIKGACTSLEAMRSCTTALLATVTAIAGYQLHAPATPPTAASSRVAQPLASRCRIPQSTCTLACCCRPWPLLPPTPSHEPYVTARVLRAPHTARRWWTPCCPS